MDDGRRHFERVDALFAAALDLPKEERSAYLDRECAGDSGLRAAVDRLLRSSEAEDDLLVSGGGFRGPRLATLPHESAGRESIAAGSRLGPYEVVSMLGEGGMGQVFKARDTRLGRDVALKICYGDRWGQEQRARFGREARAASALNHPNIVTIYDVGSDRALSYIAMEHVVGQSLRERLDEGPLDLDETLSLATQMAAALSVAHDRGIVHRDLKPGNIMISTDRTVKIVDFGLAKIDPKPRGADPTVSWKEPHTAEGAVFGTVGYMSPEQASAKPSDYRADLFSFGVILYEMLTGRRAFHRESDVEILAAILKESPEPILNINAAVPAPLEWAVARCLHKSPADRYGSTGDLARDLEAVREYRSRESTSRIRCASCATENPAGHKFCSQCGAELRQTCPSCREVVAVAAAFCGECGHGMGSSREGDVAAPPDRTHPLRESVSGAVSVMASERRQVAILATRLADYEALIERASPDETEEVLVAFAREVRESVERYDGVVDRSEGDEVVALFGIPTAHEDDSLRAVRAALDLHERLGRSEGLLRGIRPCSAVHSGSFVVHASSEMGEVRRARGEAAQVAMSLVRLAEPGHVVLSPESRRLAGTSIRTEELDPVRLRSSADPIVPHRALAADVSSQPPMESSDALLTPFAGRQGELGTLLGCVEAAMQGEGQFVAVVGEAGAGKSRLFLELRRQLDRREVVLVEGRCQSHGERVPYLPLIEACRATLRIHDEDPPERQLRAAVDHVREIDPQLEGLLPLYLQLLSLPSEEHPLPEHLEGKSFRHAMQEALAALFTLASRRRPLLLLLEDWHWVDEASHDVVRQLVEMCPGFPLLVAVSYRPEGAPQWDASSQLRAVHLGALGPVSAAAIIRSVLDADRLPEQLAALLHERTGGNPFFLEETCRTLREEGTVQVEDGEARVTGATDGLQLPDTIQAVIRTRLDRIEPAVRDVLRRASVIGREFSRSVLRRVVDDTTGLEGMLVVLKEKGLVRRIGVVPEPVYRFQHALTQEVAYDSLLQRQKKELHGRVGDAVEHVHGDRLEDHYDALARHFAEAESWSKAVEYGQGSARRARNLSQFAEALATLERTEEWLRRLPDGEDRQEKRIALLQEERLVSEILGDRARQQRAVDELLSFLEGKGDRSELVEAYIGRAELPSETGRFVDSDRDLEQALACSRRLGDSELERRALRSLAFRRWQEGRNEEALEAMERVLAKDRELGDAERIVGDLTNRGSVLRGLGRHEEALESLMEALRWGERPGSNPHRQVEAYYVMYTIYRDLGETEKGEPYLQKAVDLQREDPFTIHQPFQISALANLLVERGEPDRGIELLRAQVEKSRRSRYAFGLSRCQQTLADVLLGLGRDGEALPHLLEAAESFRRLRDPAAELGMLHKAAPILERSGDGATVRKTWERVLELSRIGGDIPSTIDSLQGLARMAEADGKASQALAHLQAALAHCGDDTGEARGEILNNIGIQEWKSGAYERALEAFDAALGLFEREGHRVHAGLAMNSIGACYKALGRTDEAVDALERALALHDETGQQLLRGHALALLGDIRLERDEIEEAIRRYRESLEIREQIGDRRGEGWMRHHLARAFLRAEDVDRAKENAALASVIAEECADEELERACGALGLR